MILGDEGTLTNGMADCVYPGEGGKGMSLASRLTSIHPATPILPGRVILWSRHVLRNVTKVSSIFFFVRSDLSAACPTADPIDTNIILVFSR